MADNIAVTPGSGITVASSDIGGVHYQKVIVQSVVMPPTFYHGQIRIVTAGTSAVLAPSQALLSGVEIKALNGNTGLIYVGKVGVTATTGFQLGAGESTYITTDNLADVYIYAVAPNEGVSYQGG